MRTDTEIVMDAFDEAKRLVVLGRTVGPKGRLEHYEYLRMVEFIMCEPAVLRAAERLKMRGQLKAVV